MEFPSNKQIRKNILNLFIPAMIEFALIQCTSLCDQIQISVLGNNAISGIGLANSVKQIFISALVSFNIGVTAITAASSGKGEYHRIPAILKNGWVLSFVVSLLFSFIGFVFKNTLLTLFKAPDSVSLEFAKIYFSVCILGFVPVSITSTITAVLRGIGDSKSPLIYNTIANVFNIVINYILILGRFGFPKLGVLGAGVATVISQWIGLLMSAIIFNIRVSKSNYYCKNQKMEKSLAKSIVSIGSHAALERGIVCIGFAIFTMVVSSLGTVQYATHTICMSIQMLSSIGAMAINVASTTLSGQSFGTCDFELSKKYLKTCLIVGLFPTVFFAILYGVFGKSILVLYSSDSDVLFVGTKLLLLVSFMQPLAIEVPVFSGFLRAAGDSAFVARTAFISSLLCRPLVAYLLISVFGFSVIGAWIGLFMDHIVQFLFMFIRYKSGKWKSRLKYLNC